MGEKVITPKEILYELYAIKGLTQKQIASIIGVSQTTIKNKMRKFGIAAKKHHVKEFKISKSKLEHLYNDLGFNQKQIAAKEKVCVGTIQRLMKVYGIPTRKIKTGGRQVTLDSFNNLLKIHSVPGHLVQIEAGQQYRGFHDKIKLRCECGVSYFDTKQAIHIQINRKGKYECQSIRKKTTWDSDLVRNFFEINGCVLLSNEYINEKVPLKYQCECGRVSTIKLTKFVQGQRCSKCGKEKRRKSRRTLLEDVREKRRKFLEYKIWRRQVFERDNFTCQICNRFSGSIAAHHLNGYDSFPEQRLVLSNGVTLCEPCHIEFHKLYGYGGNTKEQFEEFKIKRLPKAS